MKKLLLFILLSSTSYGQDLFTATKDGDIEKIKTLIATGADINARLHCIDVSH